MPLAGGHLSGTQFRSGEIHMDQTFTTAHLGGGADVVDHHLPGGGVVMRAVDARDIHAAFDQILHKSSLTGGGTRQRDHDAHAPLFRLLAKQSLGILLQTLVTTAIGAPGSDQRRIGRTHAADRIERLRDGIQRGDDVAFAAAERGKP